MILNTYDIAYIQYRIHMILNTYDIKQIIYRDWLITNLFIYFITPILVLDMIMKKFTTLDSFFSLSILSDLEFLISIVSFLLSSNTSTKNVFW